MLDAVLFDLDGTLIDTNQLIIKTFKYVMEKELNLELREETIVEYFGEPLIKTMGRYDEQNPQRLYDAYIKYNDTIHDKLVKPMDGARETLVKLKQKGIKVGIVSSKRRSMVDRGLMVCNLEGLMDVIITPEDTIKHKPEGEPLIKACEVLKINPQNSLMVGDSEYDILCGKNAGAKTCLVEYTMVPVKNILKYKPDLLVKKLTDLIEIIDNESTFNVEKGKNVS